MKKSFIKELSTQKVTGIGEAMYLYRNVRESRALRAEEKKSMLF